MATPHQANYERSAVVRPETEEDRTMHLHRSIERKNREELNLTPEVASVEKIRVYLFHVSKTHSTLRYRTAPTASR